ncbi:hypothetical protein QJ043_07340 [Olsenella sp. YH-ols2217]|uniref:Uncharacterized protein n=1 Tax=Kribbibacterium absianum TaxID=3044210 RepID=A0ABT6ZLG6_9ACTN|nr:MULTISPECIES: hypothetical protein [unclassified Olsenella]MDJ1121880.1 hypothetical protein [Olsenella sp. YH-ols2216]MDJ1129888.1 hypothetical protein [Olsenella sp. YH-ols2217]
MDDGARAKRYVEVGSYTDPQGQVTPLWVQWWDGQRFDVERVLDRRQAHSFRCGGGGLRYTVRVRGHDTYLFYENPRWFVEAKVAG